MKEKRTISLLGENIEYTLDRGKRKNTYLCISQGELLVRIPSRLSLKNAEKLILEKQEWIFSKLIKHCTLKTEISYDNNSEIYIFGQAYTIEIINNAKKNNAEIIGNKILVYLSRGEVKTIIHKFLIEIFQKKLNECFEHFCNITRLKPNKVTAKKLSRSWGRCSSDGNISISNKLVHYPPAALDYVVLHEICHLKYMNHSKEFWNMVAYYMPEYKEARNLLR